MLVQILSEELESLRRRVAGLGNVRQRGLPSTDSAAAEASPSRVAQGSIVYRALDHLHRNYTDPDMCLTLVASALECNGNYLTQRFTQLVGQRMHGYIVSLRVQRVCRELVSTDLPIKRIAYESGFRDAAGLTHTFRRQVGVSPTEYRRIFRT